MKFLFVCDDMRVFQHHSGKQSGLARGLLAWASRVPSLCPRVLPLNLINLLDNMFLVAPYYRGLRANAQVSTVST